MMQEERKQIIQQSAVTEGSRERIILALSDTSKPKKTKVSQTIKKRKVKMLTVAIMCVCMSLGVAAYSPDVRATVLRLLDGFGILGANYEKEFVLYEQEMAVVLETKEGYQLCIYKMAQSKSCLMVEYELKDPAGSVYNDILWESNLWSDFSEDYQVSHGVPHQIASDAVTGHQRVLIVYDRDAGIDFTQSQGKVQTAQFHTNNILADGKILSLEFPALEFVMEQIYEGKTYRYENAIPVGSFNIYLDEVIYEGGILQVSVLQPAFLGLDHINTEFFFKIETDTGDALKGGHRPRGTVEWDKEPGIKYRKDEWEYIVDMFASKELRLTPVMQMGQNPDTAKYIYGETIVIPLD